MTRHPEPNTPEHAERLDPMPPDMKARYIRQSKACATWVAHVRRQIEADDAQAERLTSQPHTIQGATP